METIKYTRVAFNDLRDYLTRHHLQIVDVDDTGDAIFVDVVEVMDDGRKES